MVGVGVRADRPLASQSLFHSTCEALLRWIFEHIILG
jgi:hypothetical protein